MELYQIVLLIVGVILLGLMGFAYFKKKDYIKYSRLITPIFNALNGVLRAVGNVFPGSKVIADIVAVISAGIEAAGYAENIWLQGEIDKTMRPQYAQQYIQILLEKAGIEVTDSINTIISGAIAIACYLMPHYTENNQEEE